MTLDCLCNGRYLHLNFDVTSCDFHHHVTSLKAVITVLPREVITVRSLAYYISIIFGTEIMKTDILISHLILQLHIIFQTLFIMVTLRKQLIHKKHVTLTSFTERDLSYIRVRDSLAPVYTVGNPV
jgi:hypothetical protein